jgi:hypothetical protein
MGFKMRLPNKQIEIGRHEAGVGQLLARPGIAVPDAPGKGSERVQSQDNAIFQSF